MPRTFLLINRCVVVLEWMSAMRNANFALIGNHRSDTDTHSHNKHLWEWLGVSSIGMRLKSWVQNLTNKWRKKDDEYIKQLLIFNPCACSINNTVSFTVLSRFRNIPLREWVSLYAFLFVWFLNNDTHTHKCKQKYEWEFWGQSLRIHPVRNVNKNQFHTANSNSNCFSNLHGIRTNIRRIFTKFKHQVHSTEYSIMEYDIFADRERERGREIERARLIVYGESLLFRSHCRGRSDTIYTLCFVGFIFLLWCLCYSVAV